MDIFLLNFEFSGIKNIENKVKFDFYKKIIEKTVNPSMYRVKAIYGENGGGKTAAIMAIQLLKDLIAVNGYLSDSSNQRFLNECVNKKTGRVFLSCEFLFLNVGPEIIKYEIELDGSRHGSFEIVREYIGVRKNRTVDAFFDVLLVRNGTIDLMKANESIKKDLEEKTKNLLSKQSFARSCFDYFAQKIENKNIIGEPAVYYSLGVWIFSNNLCVYMQPDDRHTLSHLRDAFETPMEKDAFGKLIDAIGTHIDNYLKVPRRNVLKKDFKTYKEQVVRLHRFIQLFKPDLKSIYIDKKVDGETYICKLIFKYSDYSIDLDFESTGIQKLVKLFDAFNNLNKGKIVFIDEFDSNINDVYFCKMIDYFLEYGNGQLCFTTHNLSPMPMLKRYKKSIDFISPKKGVVSWASQGNATPEFYYKNGLVDGIPFNIDSTDFIGIFEEG